ncbi:MAG TPA: abortive phage resistance protein [Crenotrichaceae bacterium]|nr:abortive phage resistance protein [Crenotrichaceae bacterium]
MIGGGCHQGKTEHQVWLENHKRLVHRARREPFIAHNMKKYGKLPIWVAIEIWDFGSLSRLFAGMKHQDKTQIASQYDFASGKELQGCLRSLNFIRNVAAHHSRLWNINVLEIASKPKNNEYWHSLKNNRPFFYYCSMQAMMRVICPNSSWALRFEELIKSFPEIAAKTASLSDFGIVGGWQAWPLWEYESRIK